MQNSSLSFRILLNLGITIVLITGKSKEELEEYRILEPLYEEFRRYEEVVPVIS
jgi:hypothetical protein